MKKRVLSFILAVVAVITTLPIVPLSSNAVAYDSSIVVNIAEDYASRGDTSYKNLCLGFVAKCFRSAYGFQSSSCCAYNYGSSYIDNTSKNDIPLGAVVFFGGSSVVCSGCGHKAGHIGIYVGDNKIIHSWSGKVQKTTIDYVINCGYPYRGYGWHGNYELSEGYLSKCIPHSSNLTVEITKATTLKTLPCSYRTDNKSQDVFTPPIGTQFKITNLLKNTANNYWYQTEYNGQTCYLYAGDAKTISANEGDITVSGLSVPSSLALGKSFSIKGLIKSSLLPLTEVGAYIYQGTTTSATPYMSSVQKIDNKYSYEVYNSKVDINLKFNNLPQGKYVYTLCAKVVNYSSNGTELKKAVEREEYLTVSSFSVGSTSGSTIFQPIWPTANAHKIHGLDTYFNGGTHNGIDILADSSDYNYQNIMSVANGEVYATRNKCSHENRGAGHACPDTWGNYFCIKHTVNGVTYFSVYAHVKYNSITVKAGDKVTAGQTIAQMGSSGGSTYYHLHLELWKGTYSDKNSQHAYTFDYFKNNPAQLSGLRFHKGFLNYNTTYKEWIKDNCSLNGDYYLYGTSHTHSYGAWEYSDTEQHVQYCSCGDAVYESHSLVLNNVWEPSCTYEGYIMYQCTICNTPIYETLPMIGHSYSNGKCIYCNQTHPNCVNGHNYSGIWYYLDDYTDIRYCDYCGYSTTINHQFINGICKRCGLTSFDCKYGHNYTSWVYNDCKTHKKQCNYCGQTDVDIHEYYNNWECIFCGYSSPECADGHDSYTSWYNYDSGTHARHCLNCGTVEYGDHWLDIDNGVIVTPATHTTEGLMKYYCFECEFSWPEIIDKIEEHNFGSRKDYNSTQHYRECECGEIEYSDHTFGKWENCGSSHVSECICGKTKYMYHEWDNGVVITPPSCTKTGETLFTCTVCKATEIGVSAKLDGHSFGAWQDYNDIKHKRMCDCGETEYENHNWDDGTTVSGVTTITCYDCKYQKAFVDTGDEPEIDENLPGGSFTGILGDVNLDGEIDAKDLTLLARHVAKIEYITDPKALINADINKDGGVSSEDLTKLARHVAKIEYIVQ